jgi:hypothetical protein
VNGPKATAEKTNGRNATDASVFLVRGTLWRSDIAAKRASPPTIHSDGSSPVPQRLRAAVAAASQSANVHA